MMNAQQSAAMDRLIDIAKSDTGQSRRVANFLLAWWNARSCGGFDLTDTWGLDADIASDIALVFVYVAANGSNLYPDSLGYSDDFKQIIARWRSELVER